MKFRILISLIMSVTLMILVDACTDHGIPGIPNNSGNGGNGDNDTVSFTATIHPLLLNKCGTDLCHEGPTPQHSFSVEIWEDLVRRNPVHNVPFVIPFDANASRLYNAVTKAYSTKGMLFRMPKDEDTLTTVEQNQIRNWINQGADSL